MRAVGVQRQAQRLVVCVKRLRFRPRRPEPQGKSTRRRSDVGRRTRRPGGAGVGTHSCSVPGSTTARGGFTGFFRPTRTFVCTDLRRALALRELPMATPTQKRKAGRRAQAGPSSLAAGSSQSQTDASFLITPGKRCVLEEPIHRGALVPLASFHPSSRHVRRAAVDY